LQPGVPSTAARTPREIGTWLGAGLTAHRGWTAVAFAAVAAAIYLLTSAREPQTFDYFVRLADAFLHGRIYLTEAPSWLNELIPRNSVWYVPYPPMPAVLLVPFVAAFGSGFPQQVASSLFGGVAVGLAWLVFCEFRIVVWTRVLLTAVFAFGTVLWYVAEVGSVWYLSHVVAVMFTMAAILLVLRRRAPDVAGLFLGMAAISRLPVALSVPFFVAVITPLSWPFRLPADRAAAVGRVGVFLAGFAVPVLLYLTYNWLRFGTIFDQSYVLIPGVLDDPIYAKGGIFSPIYIPRNLYAIFFRSWNYVDDPPFLQPSWWGLSIFLTTPLYLWLAKAPLRDPRVQAAGVATALVMIPILTHGNVGISQFGYRFSLDVQPFLFIILAVVFERGLSSLAVLAAIASIASCAYALWAIGIGFVAY
jgi:hypothetical protein